MESTPAYFVGAEKLAKAIDEACPEARVVITLREPKERLFSLYRHINNKVFFGRYESFGDYVNACLVHDPPARYKPDTLHLSGVHDGRYDLHYLAWRSVFGKSRTRVLFYDDMSRAYRSMLAGLESWLEISRGLLGRRELTRENRAIEYKSATLQRLAIRTNGLIEPTLNRHPRLREQLRRFYYSVNGRRRSEQPDRDTWDRLSTLYSQHLARLADLLTEDGYEELPAWLSREAVGS